MTTLKLDPKAIDECKKQIDAGEWCIFLPIDDASVQLVADASREDCRLGETRVLTRVNTFVRIFHTDGIGVYIEWSPLLVLFVSDSGRAVCFDHYIGHAIEPDETYKGIYELIYSYMSKSTL